MSETDFKVTVKVPEAARDLVVEIAARLRDDPDFFGRLRNFFEEDSRGSVVAMLRDIASRFDNFERRVDELSDNVLAVSEGRFIGPDPAWRTGHGAGSRLTEEGEMELRRLFDIGMTNKECAVRVGIAQQYVVRRRKDYALEMSCRSGNG